MDHKEIIIQKTEEKENSITTIFSKILMYTIFQYASAFIRSHHYTHIQL